MTRRQVIAAGAGLVGGASLPRLPRLRVRSLHEVPQRPNILVLMTDQERRFAHWPADWASRHLPSVERLARHGLTFDRAYIAASECSPSRATILTSRHAKVNQVPITLTHPGLPPAAELANVA